MASGLNGGIELCQRGTDRSYLPGGRSQQCLLPLQPAISSWVFSPWRTSLSISLTQ